MIQQYYEKYINNETFLSFFKFCLVGASGTLITLGTEFILTEFFLVWYGLSLSLGWMLGLVNNFCLNRQWTFHSVTGKVFRQLVVYFIITLIALSANLSMTIFLTEVIGFWYFFSSVLSVGVSTVIDYILIRNFALKPNPQKQKELLVVREIVFLILYDIVIFVFFIVLPFIFSTM
ncbi:MAG: GtrA family protein [Candidatus Heimdallarchaeota archaeon]|nr:MAG: GtrA family protein [Candidatus Heimdallarchaeota archaeon]